VLLSQTLDERFDLRIRRSIEKFPSQSTQQRRARDLPPTNTTPISVAIILNGKVQSAKNDRPDAPWAPTGRIT
jgi:hypothetical protein